MKNTRDAMPELQRELRFFPIQNPQPQHLSREQIAHFNARGFVFPLDVFDADEIAAHRAYFDQLMAKVTAKGGNSYSINSYHLRCTGIYDLVKERRILDYVQDLLGENLICWGTHYFCKMPHDEARVSWHQDASYWPLSPSKTVTVWLAIDDADEANGAMKVIPRSHLHGQINFDDSAAEEKNVLYQSVKDAEQYGDAPVSFNLRAGQVSLHSDLLLHGSEPNPSARRRCGLTMRFVPPDVKVFKGWEKGSILCRGRNLYGHWHDNPRPEKDDV